MRVVERHLAHLATHLMSIMDSKSGRNDAAASEDTDEEVDRLMVGSVRKAFRVLEAFSKARPVMGFSQIAREVGLEKSAVQRAAHTLWKLGYLDKVGRDGEYRLSLRCLDVGQAFQESNNLVQCARPYLRLLRRKLDASINLTMLDGTDTVFVVRYTSPGMLSNDLVGGLRVPAYCTATGIAMMSTLPDQDVHQIIDRSELRPVMPNTVWEPAKIFERVVQCRKDGFALGVEEDFASDITIACPITGPFPGDVAAIGASYSSEKTTPGDVLSECRQMMIGMAAEITGKLANA